MSADRKSISFAAGPEEVNRNKGNSNTCPRNWISQTNNNFPEADGNTELLLGSKKRNQKLKISL